MNKSDLLRGALHSLANSASLVEAAACLYSCEHDQGCLVLAVSAREELGRFALLARRGEAMTAADNVDPVSLKKALDDHVAKLRAGATSVSVPMREAWLEEWRGAIANNDAAKLEQLRPQFDLANRAIRKREPLDTHLRRMRAQYVDPETDGSWSVPAAVNVDDARIALMGTAAGVANTLIGLQGSKLFAATMLEVALPNMGEFITRVFTRVARRGA